MINKPKNPFFIVGSPRSGTNLMRLILDSHPEIICYGEPTSYNCFRQPQHIKHHASAVGFQITGSMYQLHKNNFWA
ncbi:sulfotransferase, partial [Enterococcus faecium]|uniref:sulfotransferase n=1 Tax=Enterococcus faecium TaxID=1352 RepID=UPI0034E95857